MTLPNASRPTGPFTTRGTTYLSPYYQGRPVALYRRAQRRR
jgi:hypothetical protein